MVDERPVSDYLEKLPEPVRRTLFDPYGAYVEKMIIRADQELMRRRERYPDAGCLVICPPGFYRGARGGDELLPGDEIEDGSDGGEGEGDEDEQDRVATVIAERIQSLTGRRVTLVLHGDPDSLIAEFRESDAEYIVAVNRISEGCDIPRLRVGLILRDIRSDLLFEQICGRLVRRPPGDDGQPGLFIMAPLWRMADFGRGITIQEAGAVPKPPVPCGRCGRLTCKCPCIRCGRRPCKCPCPDCGKRPCVCPWCEPLIETFIDLEFTGDSHITNGTDIQDCFATMAHRIRDGVPACHSRDVADIAFILQVNEQMNGESVPTSPTNVTRHQAALRTAASWTQL